MLSLDLAELVLTVAIRANVTVRSINADALAILNVLGPRQEFPTITDAALHHMLWINLDSLAQAGDTQLLGRLLDPTLPKPNPPIRTLRSSPFALARASEAGHLDFLGYWLRLARRHEAVPLTLTMVRRAMSAAVRTERLDVLAWWMDAIPTWFLTHELSLCWEAAYEAAASTIVLEYIKQMRIKDMDWNARGGSAQVCLEGHVIPRFVSIKEAVRRAHAAGNTAVVKWWFSQVSRLNQVRFLLPRMLTWNTNHLAGILFYIWFNDLSQRNGPCLRLCWSQYPTTRLLFTDLHSWNSNAPGLLADIVQKTSCAQCLDIIHTSSLQSCPIPECMRDHCINCTIPPDGLFRDRRFHKQNLSMAMCKHGLVKGFRALLRSGPDAVDKVHHQVLLVASKHGHVEILKAWLEEYAGKNEHGKYRVWDGVGIDILEWLLEHDVDRKLLQWMSVDEASRAGQTHVLDWWLDRFRKGQVPTLRFSYKALQFKSYESGMKSLRWWFRSGLLLDHGRIVVSVWRYCYLEQFELVELLVDGGVAVCFQPILHPQAPAWPGRPRQAADVIAGVRKWWERARMGNKLGNGKSGTATQHGLEECLASAEHTEHIVPMNEVCRWNRVMGNEEGL